MAASVQAEQDVLRDGILILPVAEPQAGLLAGDLVLLDQILRDAAGDAAVKGVVLALRGGHGLAAPLAGAVSAVARRLENFPKPVVACLEGTIGGAIWALALAAHYRFAGPQAQVVMPEARFGLMAAAGITQRLPRLIGAAECIKLMLSTRPESAQVYLSLGALDRVVAGDVQSEAVQALKAGLAPRRTRDAVQGLKNPKLYLAEVRAFQDRVTGDPLDVSRAVVKSVEAALLLPFAAGLAFEAVTLEDLAQAPETRAVRHAALAERAARDRLRQIEGSVKRLSGRNVTRLGIWRCGPERADLVVEALSRGLSVVVTDPSREDLAALAGRIAALQGAMVDGKSMTPEARDADAARLETSDQPNALADCGLILAGQGDLPGLGVPVAALGQALAQQMPAVGLLPGVASGHAELSLSGDDAALRAVPLVLDLARRLGWRLQVTGAAGFVVPRLRGAQRAVIARLSEMGHKGPEITAGLASVGLGAVAAGKRKPVTGAAYDIAQLALAALANEAARLLDEGAGLSALEVDAAALGAGLMPRWMGGPLYQADLRGLILMRSDLVRLGGTGGLAPSALWDRMIAEGVSFHGRA